MPVLQYNPNPPPLSQAELDKLAEQQRAMGAAVPPGGYQAYPPIPAGPPPQPAYIPESSASYQYEPLPQSPSMAGPPVPPVSEEAYGPGAPTGNTIVTSTYPATGTTTVMNKLGAVQPYYPIQVEQTYRTIPPEGSTYPSRETAYGVPPRDWTRLQSSYDKGIYPDLAPRFSGDGPLGQGPPPSPNQRYVPDETYFALNRLYFRGEGNMGTRDPLSSYSNEDRPLPGAGHYSYGTGETRPEDIWRPGWGSPYSEADRERALAGATAAGHPEILPPIGMVPDIWGGRGGHQSSYWLERSPEAAVVHEHGAGYPGERYPEDLHAPLPPPTPTYTNEDTLALMEHRRRERQLRGLLGGGR